MIYFDLRPFFEREFVIMEEFRKHFFLKYKYILNGRSSGLGTAIAIKNHIKPIEILKDLTRRIIKIILKNFSIINVYWYPHSINNNIDKRSKLFTKELPKYIPNNENVILMGDFNAVTEKEVLGRYMKALKNLIVELEFKDSHNICNKGQNVNTLISNVGNTRMDRIYLSNSLCHLIKS